MHVEHIAPKLATPRWPIVVLPALSLVVLAAWVGETGVAGWELSATREVASWPDVAGVVLRPAVELGNRVVAVVIAVVVGVRWGWRAGAVAAGGALGGSLVASVVKAAVERPRVTAAELGVDPRHVVEGFSFPSSHAAVAFGLAVGVVLAVGLPARWAAAGLVLATLTAVGRMWLGVHLPLDVLGGALAGSASAAAAAAVGRVPLRRPRPA